MNEPKLVERNGTWWVELDELVIALGSWGYDSVSVYRREPDMPNGHDFGLIVGVDTYYSSEDARAYQKNERGVSIHDDTIGTVYVWGEDTGNDPTHTVHVKRRDRAGN